MTRRRVIIIGGGLAGMAAAESLSRSRPDLQLSLLESKRNCGGRAGSFLDPATNQEVDYCQHAAMGCCTNLFDMLARSGLDGHFRRHRELTFLHPDHPPSRFAAHPFLPPPLHLWGAVNAMTYLTLTQKREIKRGLWKLMRSPTSSLQSMRAATWLTEAGQSDATCRDFWDVLLVSALGEQTHQVSMAAARKVLIDGFAIARGSSDVLIPQLPLTELFGRRLSSAIIERGVALRTRCPVQRITPSGSVICAAETLECDAILCAVPWHQIRPLFRDWPMHHQQRLPDLDQITDIPASPITGLHLWFDMPITDRDQTVMVGTVAQWLFRDPLADFNRMTDSSGLDQHYYQVVISASRQALTMGKHDLVSTVVAELQHAFPRARGARLIRHRVVTDPNSVFSLTPQTDAIRPPATTNIPWLFLAGDWTQTGWPATMEGAVISGRLAAHAVSCQLPNPRQESDIQENSPLTAPLQPSWLARCLIRRP